MFTVLVISLYGLLLTSGLGREWIMQQICSIRTSILREDLAGVFDKVMLLFVEMPMFGVLKGERKLFFELANEQCGEMWPYALGVALTSYEEVAGRFSREQSKGRYIGSRTMIDECMGNVHLSLSLCYAFLCN